MQIEDPEPLPFLHSVKPRTKVRTGFELGTTVKLVSRCILYHLPLAHVYVGVIKREGRGRDHSSTLVTGVSLQGLGSCNIYGYQMLQVGFTCVTSKHTALQYSLLLSPRIISRTEINSCFSFCFCFVVFSLPSLS
jgi:hypothetical protein